MGSTKIQEFLLKLRINFPSVYFVAMNTNNSKNMGLLSKAQYMKVNQINFQKLSNAQREAKYQRYLQKYQRSSQGTSVVNNKLAIVPFNRNNNNNLGRRANNKSNGSMITKVPNTNNLNFKLSKCLLNFARAAIDPFDNITELPCIPDNITVPSYKLRSYLEADMVVGTGGVGWAVFQPTHMYINNNTNSPGAHYDYPVTTTLSTYANTNYDWDFDLDPGVTVQGWNPQVILDDGALVGSSYRVVAAGMEVDYTGVLLNQAGIISVIQWDGLQPIPIPTEIAVIRQHPRSSVCPTSREARCYVRYEPTDPANYSYQYYTNYYPGPRRLVPYPLGIFVSGATPGTTFRIRAVAFFESQHPRMPATPSEADPVGFPAFNAARSEHLPTPDPQSDLFTILKKTASNILTNLSGFAPTIGTAIGSLFGQPALGGAVGGISKNLIESLF